MGESSFLTGLGLAVLCACVGGHRAHTTGRSVLGWALGGVGVACLAMLLVAHHSMDLPLGLGVLVLGLVVYFLPTHIAHRRNHPQARAIFWLNFLAGWSFVGWVASFVWAMIDYSHQQTP